MKLKTRIIYSNRCKCEGCNVSGILFPENLPQDLLQMGKQKQKALGGQLLFEKCFDCGKTYFVISSTVDQDGQLFLF